MNLGLDFSHEIERWDEALPLGNGLMGALVYGPSSNLRFSLDRTDIWDNSTPLNTDRSDFTYSNLVDLAQCGQTSSIRELFDSPYNYPLPSKLKAGKIVLHFNEGSKISYHLSINDAVATIDIDEGDTKIKVVSFCHAINKVGVIKVNAPLSNFSFTLEPVKYGSESSSLDENYDPEKREIVMGSLSSLPYPPYEEGKEENFSYFTQKVRDDFSYGIIVGTKEEKDESLIFYKVVTSKDSDNFIEDAKKKINTLLLIPYEELLASHKEWWKSYWDKSNISLPDKDMEKMWYVNNYLFASCSRKDCYPMPLQGVWSADDGNLPPWKGDYHNDLNTQFSYSAFYKANHLEEGECFIDFLWNLRNEGMEFAKKFYKTKGLCMPGVMTIDGKPLGGWPMYSLSPTHQIWLCMSFINYYRYTGDEDFLRNKAYIYLKESAQCISSLLTKKDDGLYYLPISSSPEIHDDEKESFLTPNSNYDLSLLYYMFNSLIKYAPEGDEDVPRWEEYLSHLPPLAINDKNVLMLSPDESLNESHRHLSNAMAIYPLLLLDYDNPHDKEIIDATILDYERLGTGYWVGFSFPWMSHLYSVSRNGEGAYMQLKIFMTSFLSSNGFHLNGDFKHRGITTFHYRPFTLEANMLSNDALQEMLFQMKDGVIRLFPSIPNDWFNKKVSFDKFLGEKGLVVSARLEKGVIQTVCLTSKMEMDVKLIGINGKEKDVHLNKNECKYFSFTDFK